MRDTDTIVEPFHITHNHLIHCSAQLFIGGSFNSPQTILASSNFAPLLCVSFYSNVIPIKLSYHRTTEHFRLSPCVDHISNSCQVFDSQTHSHIHAKSLYRGPFRTNNSIVPKSAGSSFISMTPLQQPLPKNTE